MSGAIGPDDADKAARFMQLCSIHHLPIVSLCDTPGFMVGPEVETRAHIRKSSRMFLASAKMTTPLFTIFIRKGYGLGGLAMSGSLEDSFFNVSWPTAEFGGMGLEGAAKQTLRKEAEALKDQAQRDALYNEWVERALAMGKAINLASNVEIDAIIDPAETRRWILRGLKSVYPRILNDTDLRYVDAW